MLTNAEFINKSIELHMFFMRITEEHLVFIENSLQSKDIHLIKEASTLRNEALEFFQIILSIANGHLSESVISSGELITKYTYDAEKLTEFYTGIDIDSKISIMEYSIFNASNFNYKTLTVDQISMLNNQAISIVTKILDFQSNLLTDFNECKVFVNMHPDRIDHIIDENKQYLQNINNLQNLKLVLDLNMLNQEMIFWNENMSDHGNFTSILLDPIETESIKKAREFSDIFENLTNEAKAANTDNEIISVLNKSLEQTIEYQKFQLIGLRNILECKVRSVVLPLVSEHDLREINHYLRILYDGSKIFLI